MEITITILSITLPIIGGGIGYLIKHIIEKRKELTSEINKERREIYQQYVNIVVEVFKSVNDGKNKDKNFDKNIMNKLHTFLQKYILYASPNVIVAFSNFFQFIYTPKNESSKEYTKIMFVLLSTVILEMRKDLKLNNKNLGPNGIILFRAIIKDFDEMMKK